MQTTPMYTMYTMSTRANDANVHHVRRPDDANVHHVRRPQCTPKVAPNIFEIGAQNLIEIHSLSMGFGRTGCKELTWVMTSGVGKLWAPWSRT